MEARRLRWDDLLPLVPFFVLGLGLGLWTAVIERDHVGAHGPDWDLSPLQRLLIAGNALWFYVGKLLWPAKLIFSYPRWSIDVHDRCCTWDRWPWSWWLGPCGPCAAHRLAPLVAAFIFGGTLVPALGFFNVYPMLYSFVADHFQYLSSIALIALAVGLVSGWLRARSGTPDRPSPAGVAWRDWCC